MAYIEPYTLIVWYIFERSEFGQVINFHDAQWISWKTSHFFQVIFLSNTAQYRMSLINVYAILMDVFLLNKTLIQILYNFCYPFNLKGY